MFLSHPFTKTQQIGFDILPLISQLLTVKSLIVLLFVFCAVFYVFSC